MYKVYRYELHLGDCICCCGCMLRIPGMRSDVVCSTVMLDLLMLSWFDFLLLYTSHTRINRDYWHKGESLWRAAAVVPRLLLHC